MEKCPDILLKIVETKKEEVAAARSSLSDFKAMAGDAPDALDFKQALLGDELGVIAEIKKASPSAGIIAEDFDPAKVAEAYLEGEASAVSLLTDRDYFKGDIKYLPVIREILTIPILRKDFIIDPLQIYEARAFGADSFLLISAILEKNQMEDLLGLGRELGMEALVESHNEEELFRTISADSEIIGINNRNLHNFEVDLSVSEELFYLIPETSVSVSESGIHSAEDAERIRNAGFDAVLVGESLMRSGLEGCGEHIRMMRRGARCPW